MITVGILTTITSIASAYFAYKQATQARSANRVDQLENRLKQSDKDTHLLYTWNRQLVDHIYKQDPPPPPPPPTGLFDH